jgi:hypothetical protein
MYSVLIELAATQSNWCYVRTHARQGHLKVLRTLLAPSGKRASTALYPQTTLLQWLVRNTSARTWVAQKRL